MESAAMMSMAMEYFHDTAAGLYRLSEEVRQYLEAEFTDAGIIPAEDLSDVPATIRSLV